jgi:tetratricopeptide (TPR) repeat protein
MRFLDGGIALRPRLICLIASLLLLTTVATGDPSWVEVRSQHFTIYTDGGEKRGREVLTEFEQMRALFGMIVKHKDVNSNVPLKIVAFRNTKEMKEFSPLWKGKPIELSGYFQGGEDCNYILLDLSQSIALQAVFHEYTHSLENANFNRMPPWFDEGFAQYFSTLQFSGDKVKIGLWPAGYDNVFRSYNLMPTARLLEIKHDSPEYNESGDRRTMFYAQSWLMVHYLQDKIRLKDFDKYRTLIMDEGAPTATAFQQAFGVDVKQFDRILSNYLHGSDMLMFTGTVPLPKDETMTAQPFSENDRDALFAEVHGHLRDYQGKAVDEFLSVLQKDPKNVAAHRGLGYVYLYERKYGSAAEHFQQAAQLDPKDARVHYYSALLARMSGKTDDAAAKHDLETAVALDPTFADAFNLLAGVDRDLRDYDACITAEQQAIQLSPRRDDYKANIATCYMDQDRWDEAEQVYQGLAHSEEPLTAAKAQRMLTEIDELKKLGAHHAPPDTNSTPTKVAETSVPVPPPVPPEIRFLKGTLLKVECTHAPAAVLIVASGKEQWRFLTPDIGKVLTLGADAVECSWAGRPVSINYYPGSGTTGRLFSVEVPPERKRK